MNPGETTTLSSVPSERVAKRAVRLLAERRVRIVAATGTSVDAEVHGAGGIYDVTYGRAVRDLWLCTCDAATLGHRQCSHVVAVEAVWQPEPQQRTLRAV